MADITITLAGNLTADLELSKTEAGVAFATFALAVTPRIRTAEGWADAPTTFQRCVVWRDQAEAVAASLHKGDRVLVTGTLRTRSYVSSDGEHRHTCEVVVDECGPSLRWASAQVHRHRSEHPAHQKATV